MRRQPVRDRLAVWTYVEAGEEIPCADPSVTDAERAAAGRETLAQRWRELLEPNRRRATRQYAAGLPDGEDVARVWYPRDPARLTLQWAGRLQRAGRPCRHQEWVGGHDSCWWQQQLPGALAWLLPRL